MENAFQKHILREKVMKNKNIPYWSVPAVLLVGISVGLISKLAGWLAAIESLQSFGAVIMGVCITPFIVIGPWYLVKFTKPKKDG